MSSFRPPVRQQRQSKAAIFITSPACSPVSFLKRPTPCAPLLMQVTVQVTASPEGGAAAVAGAEVTLYGVDMSFLSLLPYDLPKPQLEMVVQVAADVTLYGTSAYRLAPGAVRAVFDTLMRRRVGPRNTCMHRGIVVYVV